MVFSVIKNPQGFSLVQVLVVLGIVGIISAGTASMMSNTMKAQRGISLNDELQNAMTTVRMHMSKKNICTANLDNIAAGKNFDGNNLDAFNTRFNRLVNPEDGNQVLLADNQAVPGVANTNVRIQLANMRKVVDNRNYVADIVFTFDKDAGDLKNVAGAQQVVRTMSILFDTYNTGATQTMTSCSVFDSNALSTSDFNEIKYANCQALGGTWSNGQCDLTDKICAAMGATRVNNTCSFNNMAVQNCANMGGSWDGTRCNLPQPDISGARAQVKAEMCGSLGGSWNGSSCAVPTRGISSVSRHSCGAITVTRGDGTSYTLNLVACSDDNGGG